MHIFSSAPVLSLDSPCPSVSPVLALAPNVPSSMASTSPSLTSFGPHWKDGFGFEAQRASPGSNGGIIELGEPLVFVDPVNRKITTKRPVHVSKDTLVNWARPLHKNKEKEPEQSSSVRIFGVSLQRNRRLLSKVPHAFPSPSSSSDESPTTPAPSTPTSEDAPELASSSDWNAFFAPKLAGLGVSGIDALDTLQNEITSAPAKSNIPESRFCVPPKLARTLSKRAETESSACSFNLANPLNLLSSPSTLAELATLRQAAVDLETEAKKPLRTSFLNLRMKEKRIRRKAVPALPDVGLIVETTSPAEPQVHFLVPDILPPQKDSTDSTSVADDEEEEEEQDRVEVLSAPRLNSSIARLRELPARVYGNRFATMSVIEFSSRVSSRRSPWVESTGTNPIPAPKSGRFTDSPVSSSTETEESEPVTPKSTETGPYRSKEAFMSMLDLGLHRLGSEKMERQRADRLSKDSKGEKGKKDGKFRQGLTKFLRRR